jgi:hypothetical protein
MVTTEVGYGYPMMYLWVYQGKRIDLHNIEKDKGKQEQIVNKI